MNRLHRRRADYSGRDRTLHFERLESRKLLAIGDADSNGAIDAADYVIWRASLGSQADLYADSNFSGTVDAADYDVWRASFGIIPLQVTQVGAIPNDTGFDDAAIQAAINQSASVYFASGEYWINSTLAVPSGRTLYGPATGPPAVIRVRFDTGGNANNYGLHIVGDNVVIQNLVIDKDFIDGSYGVGILAQNHQQIVISNVEIRDYSVRYGIHLIECSNFTITGCYIHDFMMNQRNANGYGADMIEDSPAGIRITRSSSGVITNSRIHNIEVGPLGRASISELRPSYGLQGYQADCITLSDSSGITVENNNLWNSGELVDILVSDHCTVQNNTMQMAYLFVAKCIGSQNSIVRNNYISDGPVGIVLSGQAEPCTGNLIDGNNIVNCGAQGIFDTAPGARFGYALSGINIDDVSGNTITSNRIFDYYHYLQRAIRQSTGNTFSNNSVTSTEFGPGGGGDAMILGAWTSGLSHPKELIALNRALVFFTYAEDDAADISATAVTYGGRTMTPLSEYRVTDGSRRIYVSSWLLRQDAINMAANGDFNVTWNSAPDSVGYSSVFLANIYQPTPLYTASSAETTIGNTVTTDPQLTHFGDIMLYGAASSEPGEFTANNDFIEALEITILDADATGGYKVASGADDAASLTHSELGTAALQMIVMRKNPAVIAAGAAADATLLRATSNTELSNDDTLQNVPRGQFQRAREPEWPYLGPSVFVPTKKVMHKTDTGGPHGVKLTTETFRIGTLSHQPAGKYAGDIYTAAIEKLTIGNRVALDIATTMYGDAYGLEQLAVIDSAICDIFP